MAQSPRVPLSRSLQPSWLKIWIVLGLLMVAVLGHDQGAVFADRSPRVPLPETAGSVVWLVWVTALLPLSILWSGVGGLFGLERDLLHEDSFWLFWGVQVLYFFALAILVELVVLIVRGRIARPFAKSKTRGRSGL